MILFNPFLPMEPKLDKSNSILKNKDYIYQVKWDGVRGLIHVNKNKIKIFNKKMKDKTIQYPELEVLKKFNKDLILDGEIIVLRNGIPSFSNVIKRDFAVQESKIKSLVKELPVTYCIFDLLYIDGKTLISFTWKKRNEYILELKEKGNFYNIYFTESFPEGENLYDIVKRKNMEGIVAKRVDSVYEPGIKSNNWMKIKYRRQQYCVVCGYTTKDLRPSALLLGVYNDLGELLYVGRAGSGLSGKTLNQLVEASRELRVSKPPVVNSPKKTLNYIWLKPVLTVLVEFAEWTDDLSLRAPVIKGFTKVKPEECKL